MRSGVGTETRSCSARCDGAQHDAILDALPAWIARIDATGIIVEVNSAWRNFAGNSVPQMPGHDVGVNFLELCGQSERDAAPDQQSLAAGIRSVLAGRLPRFIIEQRIDDAHGRPWFRISVTPLADGRSTGAVIMHTDISERKIAQERVAHLAERLSNTFNSITDAFFTVDAQWRFSFVNPEAERLMEQRAEDLLGRELWAAFPTAVGSSFEREYRAAVEHQNAASFAEYFPALGKWFSVRAFPSDQGLAVYFRDITESRAAAEALRASESGFRALAEAMPQMVWTTDANGLNNYANRQWLDYTGLSLEQTSGQGWAAVLHPDDRRGAQGAWLQARARAGVLTYECRLRGADGHYRWWLARAVPLQDDDGAVIKWFGTCTDIHDLKSTELKYAKANRELWESGLRIKRLNRVHAMLSQINALIIRVGSRDELFFEACRLAIELGGFRLAWIGLLDTAGTALLPVAWSGDAADLLASAPATLFARKQAGTSRFWRAVRRRCPQVSNALHRDRKAVLREQLVARGIASYAAIPLILRGRVAGVFTLYSGEVGFFDGEETALLQELAANIALAVEHLDKQARLDYLAYYDELTGLANRTLFLERVAQHMRSAVHRGRKLAVFVIDLERFKSINDSLGWSAGDALLQQVAARMADRGGDASLFARIGADQFAAVLPEVHPEGDVARVLAKSMEDLRNHPFELDGAVLRIAIKVGVAVFPADGDSAEMLFQHAEAALKRAKATGDRFLLYSSAMSASIANTLTLENKLRRALDQGEFVLHYQPKVDVGSDRVTSAEALIRWNDGNGALVSPACFIPVLEQTGLIHEVGRWALRQAIDDYLGWLDSGLAGVRIAVNVSPLQLQGRGFVDDLEILLAIDPRAAAGLELEITESMIMADIKHGIRSLQAIRALGVSIALDDFGTGFSSLSHLSRLPIDTLKIDRSFITDMTGTQEGLAIVSSIINLSHALKHPVVAEGVETEEQWRLLRLLGCDEIQGYYFAAPMPAEEFRTHLSKRD